MGNAQIKERLPRYGRSDQNKKAKASKSSGAKIPTSQSWSGGVRRAGDGQASASPSTVTVATTMQQLVFCFFLRFSFLFNYWERNRSVRYYCGQIGRTGPERRFSIHDSFVTHSYGSQSADGSSALPSLTSSFIDGAASWTDTTRLESHRR